MTGIRQRPSPGFSSSGGFLLAALDAVGYGLVLSLTDNLAYLNALWAFALIITVVLGMVILRELDHKLIKISGSIVATAGFFCCCFRGLGWGGGLFCCFEGVIIGF